MHKIYFNFFLLTFLALVARFAVCSGTEENRTDGTSPQTGDGMSEKSSLEKGMEPIFKLLHGFLDTVMPYNFYSQDDSPFSVQDLQKIIKNSEYSKIQQDWQSIFRTFGGYAACFILGLLFVVVFPIVTGCFCCCFCCCKNCGGAKGRYDSSKRAGCMRMTCAALLLVFTTMMLAGAIITFLGADLFHKALKNENNEGVLGKVDASLVSLQTFTVDTVKDLKTKTSSEVGSGLKGIKREVEATAHETVVKVKSTINATSILDQAEYLGNATLEISNDLKQIKTSVGELKNLQENVTATLNDIKTGINASCNSTCQSGLGIDTTKLTFNPEFKNLDELDNQTAEINKTQDIKNLIKNAKSKFDNVSADVNKSVENNIASATDKINEIDKQLSEQLKKVDNATDPFNKSLEEGRKFITDNQKDIGKISDYIWYGCIGVACAVLLVVFFYYMGVLFGMCGERPGKSPACCNRGTGANLLYTGIYFSSVFSWIVMLVVAILFLTGGLTYTLVCQYIGTGVENVGTFETVVQDSMGWNISNAFGVKNLTISGMFKNCKDDQAIYTALRFDSLFNIDDIVNITDIERQVDQMTTTSLEIGNITLMSEELEKQLLNFASANLENISFNDYIKELDTEVIGTNLGSLADKLEGSGLDKLESIAADIRSLQADQLKQVDNQKEELRKSLLRLQSHVNLTYQVQSLIDGIQNAQDTFNQNKDNVVKQSLTEATSQIKKLIKDTVNKTKDSVKRDIGKCRPLYDAAQGVADGVCNMGVDSFNSIWFGLGWAAFFYIPCFICAAVLAAYYMKIGPHHDDPKHEFDDPNHETYNGYSGSHQDNIPLTSQYMPDRINGKFNGAYDRNEGIEYRRDPHSSGYGYDPYQGHGSGYHEGGSRSPDQPPPDYDELAWQDLSGRASGGYPKSYNY